ncbi:aldehyde dehydrogenase family protein, partial [Zhongshania sp.]|uniref:aldehyde dehydrogenase family protein n=1 Tax=Zhongshania sp. TaxID=1971902 RepID=UPI0035621191
MKLPVHAGYIDGQLIEGLGAPLVVENPSTGEQLTQLPGLSLAQVEAAIVSSRRAYDAGVWSGLSVNERAGVLRNFIKALASRYELISDMIVAEAG